MCDLSDPDPLLVQVHVRDVGQEQRKGRPTLLSLTRRQLTLSPTAPVAVRAGFLVYYRGRGRSLAFGAASASFISGLLGRLGRTDEAAGLVIVIRPVIVLTAGKSAFRVYRGVLASQSSVFSDMLDFPQPTESTPQMDGCPIVELSDSGIDLTVFLGVIFPLPSV